MWTPGKSISVSEDDFTDPHLTLEFSNKKVTEEVIDQKTAIKQIEDFVSDMNQENPEQLRPVHLIIPENTCFDDLFKE